jgi:hypothetical protein
MSNAAGVAMERPPTVTLVVAPDAPATVKRKLPNKNGFSWVAGAPPKRWSSNVVIAVTPPEITRLTDPALGIEAAPVFEYHRPRFVLATKGGSKTPLLRGVRTLEEKEIVKLIAAGASVALESRRR